MWIAAILALAGTTAAADRREILVSAEDGKPVRPGDTAASTVPDRLAVLEFTGGTLRRIGAVDVPASMTGPPESVKITPDGRYAIVSAAQRANAAPPPLVVPDDAVSVVDLRRPRLPRVVDRVHAGAGAAGVAIGPAGTMVLVANGVADSVSVFTLRSGRLTARGTVMLPARSKPVSIRIAPDGRHALVVGQAGRLFRLNLQGADATLADDSLALGESAFSISLDPAGRYAYVVAGQPASIAVVDTAAFRTVATVPIGTLIENVALSPSGRYLQATLINGTNLAADDPSYHAHGLVAVFATGGATLRRVADAPTGKLCQGAAWSHDEERIFLQCAGDRRIETYRFDGTALTADGAPLPTDGRPGAMAGRDTR